MGGEWEAPRVKGVTRGIMPLVGHARRGGRWSVHVARKLSRLSPGEWHRLVLAQVALIRAQLQLKRRPVGELVQLRDTVPVERGADRLVAGRAWALAVSRAAHFGLVRAQCLARSLALVSLLDRHGVGGATIRAGVRIEHGKFTAHAWVELDETIISDPPSYVARFEPLLDLRVFEGS